MTQDPKAQSAATGHPFVDLISRLAWYCDGRSFLTGRRLSATAGLSSSAVLRRAAVQRRWPRAAPDRGHRRFHL